MVTLPPPTSLHVSIADDHEIWVTDDKTPLAGALVQRLREAGLAGRVIDIRAPASKDNHAPIGGVIILGPTAPSTAAQLGISDAQAHLKFAFQLAQRAACEIRHAAKCGGALIATVSRLDGAFGLLGGDFDPLDGGLAGLAKTASHEWPGVHCRALDVAPAWDDAAHAADAIVRELWTEGPVEVGLDRNVRRGLQLIPQPVTPGSISLSPGDVVVLTGGARGVTAEVAVALAGAVKPTLVLLGRSPAAAAEPDWLVGLNGEPQIKRAILAHGLGGESKKSSPAELESAYRRHMANREVRRNTARMEAAGARVIYHTVDIRNADEVKSILDDIRNQAGPVRAIIHGAGVLEDRRIEDKTQQQFDAVFDTKVAGLCAVLAAVPAHELRYLVLFSSVSARFGRQGQVDYAMANEVLNKVSQCFARSNPACRAVSINWGPWDGGMVNPALKRELARQGVPLISLEAGAQALIAELGDSRNRAAEVVLGAAFESTSPAHRATLREQSHEESSRFIAPATIVPSESHVIVAFERVLDLKQDSFLRSHVIGGHAVLPVTMTMEWLAHGAMHENPELSFHGLDELRVLRGVILHSDRHGIRVVAHAPRRSGSFFEVDVELHGGPPDEVEVVHARAKCILAEQLPAAPGFELPDGIDEDAFPCDVDTIYQDILFHGPLFQGIRKIAGLSQRGLIATLRSAGDPASWMINPLRSAWLADPLILDAGLQLGLLWCHERLGALSLPSFGASYRQYRLGFPRGDIRAVLIVREVHPLKMTGDIAFLDREGSLIAYASRFDWILDTSLKMAFRRRTVAEATS